MSLATSRINIEDIHVTEADKSSLDYLQQVTDWNISRLVYDKTHIKKCRNLYEGVRDKEEFGYLEKTFGVETPIAIKMTPLVKTRIDVLLGIMLDETLTYKVSINDEISILDEEEQKKSVKVETILKKYKEATATAITDANRGVEPEADTVNSKYIEGVEELINEKFISSFEIAAQSLIKLFEQDITIDLRQKLKQYLLDLLVTGEAYYKTEANLDGDPSLRIIKPENMFYEKNTNHQFMSTGYNAHTFAAVNREYMTREEILSKHGHLMNDMDKTNLFGAAPSGAHHVIRSPREISYANRYREQEFSEDGQYRGGAGSRYIPVFYSEWLVNNEVELNEEESDDLQTVEEITSSKELTEFYGKDAGSGVPKKKIYRLDRYETIRVGNDIYLNCGKSRFQPRSAAHPWKTILSFNGISYNDRNGKPQSMAWNLKDLQDTYDVVQFFRDNLIANSGVDGSRINLAAIPKVLGNNFMERVLKFMALRKQGVELIDPTEDGASLFQHYGEFKASLDGNSIQAIEAVLETIERQADMVSGVNRHMYQAAEVRDAASNVKVGQQTTSLITKDLFELLAASKRHILTDMVNRAKLSYSKGKRGTYVVGERRLLFEIMPENLCFTDFNIHILDSHKENLRLEKLHAIIPQLVAANALDPEVLIEITMLDSPTRIVKLVKESAKLKKEENNAVMQLTQQLEAIAEQSKQLNAELNKVSQQNQALVRQSDQLRAKEIDIKDKRASNDYSVAKEKNEIARKELISTEHKNREIIKLEREQLYASEAKGNSREVRNDF